MWKQDAQLQDSICYDAILGCHEPYPDGTGLGCPKGEICKDYRCNCGNDTWRICNDDEICESGKCIKGKLLLTTDLLL